MQAPRGAPDWAASLFTRFASGASGQFILCGNVHDQMPLGGRLVSIERYLQDELLSSFAVSLLLRPRQRPHGRARRRAAGGVGAVRPCAACRTSRSKPSASSIGMRVISATCIAARAHATSCTSPSSCAAPISCCRADGKGFEHGSLTSLVREWGSGRLFTQLPFASLLIADNLSDLEPLIAYAPRSTLVRVPLPAPAELQSALAILQKDFPQTIPPGTNLSTLAASMTGVSAQHARADHQGAARTPSQVLQSSDLAGVKKEMVEQEAPRAHRVRRVLAHARGLSRPRSAEELAAAGREALARQRSQGAADGLPAVRPDRHRQDLPGRVPGGRGAACRW